MPFSTWRRSVRCDFRRAAARPECNCKHWCTALHVRVSFAASGATGAIATLNHFICRRRTNELEPTGRPNVTEGLRLINCTTNIAFPLHIVQTQNIIFTSQARQESSPTTGIRFNPKRYEFFLPFALLEATADDRRAGNQYLSLRKSINRVPRGAPRDEQDGFSDGKFEAGTSSSGRDVNAALKGFRSVRSAIIQSPLVTGATGPSMLALISLRLSFHAQSTQNSVKKDQYRLHGPRMIRVSYVISQGLVHSSFSSDIELIHGNKVDNQKGLNPRMRSDTVNLRGRIAERCGASIRTFFRRRSKENIFFRI